MTSSGDLSSNDDPRFNLGVGGVESHSFHLLFLILLALTESQMVDL